MKAKEEIALKCAAGGAIAGLFLGVASAVWTVQQNGAGFMSLIEAALQVVLWTFACALLGGGLAYIVLWVAGRKVGLAAAEPGADLVLLKSNSLRCLQAETHQSYLDITRHVVSADVHLNAAEQEFAEGAFAPFWDEIEHAANELAAYKNEVEHIRRSVDGYRVEAVELEHITGSAPELNFPLDQLPDARPAAARFAAIVRKAQTNFQFAVIFEQRKTNHLLHTGFGTLGAAIYSLGDSINSSLDTLSKAINPKSKKLIAEKTQAREFMKSLHDPQREHAERLDRIQNRGKNAL
jgi:hypothetical protein